MKYNVISSLTTSNVQTKKLPQMYLAYSILKHFWSSYLRIEKVSSFKNDKKKKKKKKEIEKKYKLGIFSCKTTITEGENNYITSVCTTFFVFFRRCVNKMFIGSSNSGAMLHVIILVKKSIILNEIPLQEYSIL